MFSVLFPGQGSQSVGMGKELHDNFGYIKNLFDEADDVLNLSISKLIFEGPKELLDQTENTQPAIFLVSYSIFQNQKYKFKKKCPLSGKGAPIIDYKNIKLLKRYISENGKILPSIITSVSQKKQRELSLSIKRARNLALI